MKKARQRKRGGLLGGVGYYQIRMGLLYAHREHCQYSFRLALGMTGKLQRKKRGPETEGRVPWGVKLQLGFGVVLQP